MSTLEIRGLRAAVGDKEILNGIDLTVSSGEVHAVMGPNGAGKSTLSAVVMGKPGYKVLGGTVTLDGVDVLALAAWERAVAGLHLVMQYPTEVPGVMLDDVLTEAFVVTGPLDRRSRGVVARRGGADRLRRAVPAPPAQRRPVGRREEAQRDAAARRARTEDRHPRRARLRSRHRRAARLRPPGRGDEQRIERRQRAARRARRSRTTTGCSTSSSPITCTSSSRDASSRAVGPNWPPNSRPTGTPPLPAPSPRPSRPACSTTCSRSEPTASGSSGGRYRRSP